MLAALASPACASTIIFSLGDPNQDESFFRVDPVARINLFQDSTALNPGYLDLREFIDGYSIESLKDSFWNTFQGDASGAAGVVPLKIGTWTMPDPLPPGWRSWLVWQRRQT